MTAAPWLLREWIAHEWSAVAGQPDDGIAGRVIEVRDLLDDIGRTGHVPDDVLALALQLVGEIRLKVHVGMASAMAAHPAYQPMRVVR